MDYIRLAKDNEKLLIEMRRHMHENPELSGEETETVKYISDMLAKFGIEHVVVNDGGVLGFIRGREDGRTILLRADCDALPIQEDSCNYKQRKTCISRKPGVQHACGHDLHTASLLVSAKLLKEHWEDWKGNAVLFFERSEERGGPYQKNLLQYIDDHGIKVDGAWAMHVGSAEAGKAVFAPGPSGAGAFGFEFTIKGKGGHGARPYEANNPIACFQAIANAADQLRMTRLSPYEPATLTICTVHAGMAGNIIPETLTFSGNGRFFDKENVGKPMKERLVEIVHKCAELHHCEIETEKVSELGNPNVAAPVCARIAEDMFRKEFSDENYEIPVDFKPSMGSESFANIAAVYPSIMFGFGVVNQEKGITAGIHHPKFDIDEEKAYYAVAYTLGYTKAFLEQ